MSEGKSFMRQLDEWTETTVIDALTTDAEHEDLTSETVEQVKRAIREKVRESYHNGQAAGPRKFGGRNGGQYGR